MINYSIIDDGDAMLPLVSSVQYVEVDNTTVDIYLSIYLSMLPLVSAPYSYLWHRET
jgi:hypothetical protein